jgi:two-component system sensor histidine kinase RegB
MSQTDSSTLSINRSINRDMEQAARLRLETLVRLRWVAVLGQLITVLMVHFVLKFPVPLAACLAVIAVSAWLNIFLSLRWRRSERVGAWSAGWLLTYDILQLALLLYLTGGLANPFTFLFLVPVTVAAASLPLPWIAGLVTLTLAAASLLAFFHLPLPWAGGVSPNLPLTYLAGLWTAVISGLVFAAIYVRSIAAEARRMAAALAATEMVLAREQQLSALDGLAAAAAHELGTPLATIALVAKELRHEAKPNAPIIDDLDLLVSQSARCREILSRLANRDAQRDAMYEQVKLSALMEDLVAPLRGSDVAIAITTRPANPREASPEPVFARNPAITYGLSNLMENAVDFADGTVTVTATWSLQQVVVKVHDDGPGFAQYILDRIGEPFVTSRPGYDAAHDPLTGEHEGMGLGVFIAKTLLERSGATVSLANGAADRPGATITVAWPRRVVDQVQTSSTTPDKKAGTRPNTSL